MKMHCVLYRLQSETAAHDVRRVCSIASADCRPNAVGSLKSVGNVPLLLFGIDAAKRNARYNGAGLRTPLSPDWTHHPTIFYKMKYLHNTIIRSHFAL